MMATRVTILGLTRSTTSFRHFLKSQAAMALSGVAVMSQRLSVIPLLLNDREQLTCLDVDCPVPPEHRHLARSATRNP